MNIVMAVEWSCLELFTARQFVMQQKLCNWFGRYDRVVSRSPHFFPSIGCLDELSSGEEDDDGRI